MRFIALFFIKKEPVEKNRLPLQLKKTIHDEES
jgi:hypothetical protein